MPTPTPPAPTPYHFGMTVGELLTELYKGIEEGAFTYRTQVAVAHMTDEGMWPGSGERVDLRMALAVTFDGRVVALAGHEGEVTLEPEQEAYWKSV